MAPTHGTVGRQHYLIFGQFPFIVKLGSGLSSLGSRRTNMKKLRIFLANIGLFRATYPMVSPPMGLLYLAGYLRTKFDLDIRIVNQRAERYSNEELLRRIIEFQPDVVGFETLTRTRTVCLP